MNVIAVDVGTTSVRLAIISFLGEDANEVNILASDEKDIKHYQDGCKFEQNTNDIWQAICECSKKCIKKSKVQSNSIKSIAFSATCSLVIQDAENSAKNKNDVIMWMDHRAIEEANAITNSNSIVLSQFGGACSPEFSLSKIVWLRNNARERFQSCKGLFELPDWLVYRCIGGASADCPRSLCSLVCKWGYQVEKGQHCDLINLIDDKIHEKVGERTLGPGTVAGFLCSNSARELGIIPYDLDYMDKENTGPFTVVVGTSLIDAHSGMLAMLSAPLRNYGIEQEVESTFCSLAGTSSCHMIMSKDRNFTHGIWGPYKDVILQDYYLLEAGQSLTGKLIEICIESHNEGKARLFSGESMKEIIARLNELALSLGDEVPLHVLPTYHGNRSPLANANLKGGIYGFTADRPNSLLEHYIATVESIVFETKLIVETLGIKLKTVLVSGGLMKNTLYMQILADVLACNSIRMSLETSTKDQKGGNCDFMVMGSGLVARQALLNFIDGTVDGGEPLNKASIENIKYQRLGIQTYHPRKEKLTYYETKYLCYKEFVEFSQRVDKILHK